jgi:DNA polymerase sigma
MKNKVKDIDLMKDSVRKERQGFISIVENIVKNTFSNKYGNGYVGIKIFGSMATELAIETSDVDLVVTGINSFGNNQH